MIEILNAIAYTMSHEQSLIDVFGERWVHGNFSEDHHEFPRLAYKYVPSGGEERNTGPGVVENVRIRFQNWATNDQECMIAQRLLATWFNTEFPVVAINNNQPRILFATKVADDMFEEPGPEDPVAGTIWQGVLDIAYVFKRLRTR